MILTEYANWFGKLLRTRVKLEHPEAPEDARRYESYRRLRRLYQQLWEQRPEREQAARPR